MAQHDMNEVSVSIDGTDYTLQPTLAAIKAIDRQFGSVSDALEALRKPSIGTVTFLVATGANVPKADREALEEAVFREGVIRLVGPCSDYLVGLWNPSGKTSEGDEGKA